MSASINPYYPVDPASAAARARPVPMTLLPFSRWVDHVLFRLDVHDLVTEIVHTDGEEC